MDTAVIAALIAASVGVLTLIANVVIQERARRNERAAVITAFRSDIRSIVHVLHRMGIVDSFIDCLHSSLPTLGYTTWVDAPREENYFQLYASMASKIGLTPFPLAKDIVRFYTFLHASRDSARPLGVLKASSLKTGEHVQHIRNVLVALCEVLRAADNVLGAEFSPRNQKEGQDIATEMWKKIDAALKNPNDTKLAT